MKKPAVKKDTQKSKIDELIAKKIQARAQFQSHGFGSSTSNTGNKHASTQPKRGNRGDR